ncbi:MAG TPA: 50S ribosomal protein L25/general stress protein Ctc [Burkholderiales bacterium]|nr:50S ribosomal protein L25/general stress protein Ctc [Burkholderiales bacterium]
MKIEFAASARKLQGKGASRRLRNDGRVPGILYGGDTPAQSIELDHKELFQHMRKEAFHASILTMNLDGKPEPVLLRDVQMHPWKARIAHVDFQRVSADRKIHMKVPLHFVNVETSPGVKAGGVLSHVANELEVTCLPGDLPEFIIVDCSSLTLGHSIHLADLQFPKGVESPTLRRGGNPVIATLQVPKAHVEEAAAAAAEGAAAEGATPAAAAPAAAAGKKDEKKEEKKG